MNDREREMWVENDQSLYVFRRQTRLSMRQFIRTYRAEIDSVISAALAPKQKTWRDYV